MSQAHMFVTNCAGGEGYLRFTKMSRTGFLVANSFLCHELIYLSRTHIFVTKCAGGEGHFHGCSTGAQLPQIRARCNKTVCFFFFLPHMKLPYMSRTYLSRTRMWCCFQILPQMYCAFGRTQCDMSRTHITNWICHELNLSPTHTSSSNIGFCRRMHYHRASAHTTTLMIEFVTIYMSHCHELISRAHIY